MSDSKLEKLLYIKKDYSEIKELLKFKTDSRSFNMLGQIYLNTIEFDKAYEYFEKANNKQNCAYIKFLTSDLESALNILNPIKDESSFINWLINIINLLKNKESYPTYFQIRNFYEQDLEMLFKCKQNKLINSITGKIKYISKYNLEIYKYTGRVLYNNKYIEISEKYLKKSIEICYKDPETHFLLGEIYLKKDNINEAVNEFRKAIEVNGRYIPAEYRLKDLLN